MSRQQRRASERARRNVDQPDTQAATRRIVEMVVGTIATGVMAQAKGMGSLMRWRATLLWVAARLLEEASRPVLDIEENKELPEQAAGQASRFVVDHEMSRVAAAALEYLQRLQTRRAPV